MEITSRTTIVSPDITEQDRQAAFDSMNEELLEAGATPTRQYAQHVFGSDPDTGREVTFLYLVAVGELESDT